MQPEFSFDFSSERPQNFDRLHDWFGVWSMHEPQAVGLFRQVSKANLQVHINETQAAVAGPSRESDRLGYTVIDGIALISISGTMMKYSGSFGGGASTVLARRAIRAAGDDSSVKAVMMLFDSPGGTVSGTPDLAADIAALKAKKPVWGYIEDLGASAAYWGVSQTEHIRVNSNALVGSIGVFSVVEDESGLAESLRVKVHVIKAGEFKGAGVPGSVVTDKQIAEWQRNVDAIYGQFIDAVAKGRGMDRSKVESLADGRVHMGEEAVRLGLADRVSSLDEALADLRTKASGRTVTGSPGTKGSKAMSDSNPAANAAAAPLAPQAATLKELKAACDGAPADFLMSQLEDGATAPEAMKAWNAKLKADLATEREKSATAAKQAEEAGTRAAAAASTPRPAGVRPPKSDVVAEDAEDTGDSAERFNTLVSEVRQRNPKMERADAVDAVAAKNPDLHQAFLLATNPGRRQQRLIREKFE